MLLRCLLWKDDSRGKQGTEGVEIPHHKKLKNATAKIVVAYNVMKSGNEWPQLLQELTDVEEARTEQQVSQVA